jgi:hypothetical protein
VKRRRKRMGGRNQMESVNQVERTMEKAMERPQHSYHHS